VLTLNSNDVAHALACSGELQFAVPASGVQYWLCLFFQTIENKQLIGSVRRKNEFMTTALL
jgi:hypothetical protein